MGQDVVLSRPVVGDLLCDGCTACLVDLAMSSFLHAVRQAGIGGPQDAAMHGGESGALRARVGHSRRVSRGRGKAALERSGGLGSGCRRSILFVRVAAFAHMFGLVDRAFQDVVCLGTGGQGFAGTEQGRQGVRQAAH